MGLHSSEAWEQAVSSHQVIELNRPCVCHRVQGVRATEPHPDPQNVGKEETGQCWLWGWPRLEKAMLRTRGCLESTRLSWRESIWFLGMFSSECFIYSHIENRKIRYLYKTWQRKPGPRFFFFFCIQLKCRGKKRESSGQGTLCSAGLSPHELGETSSALGVCSKHWAIVW